VITFTQTKTGGTVQVPIHQDLKSWLQSHKNGEWVFPSLAGKKTGGTTGLSLGFAKLLREAGIESEEIRERSGKKGRVVHALSYHSLRHTMNSILANEGVSQELRQSIVGHASKTINSHYTHLELSTMQSVIAKLPKIG
jgi:integrase